MISSDSMKGIILAGGSGTRLHPITLGVSKQLIPVYDKPMVYYPLTTLMLAGIRDVLVITTPHEQDGFRRLLGDGSQFGIRLAYAVQPRPEGLAQAFLIGREFVGRGRRGAGARRQHLLRQRARRSCCSRRRAARRGATVFAYRVRDPQRYGVVEFDAGRQGRSASRRSRRSRARRTRSPASTSTTTACSTSPRRSQPSPRGELEITDVNRAYLACGRAARRAARPRAWPGSTPAPTRRCCRPRPSSRRSRSGRT